MNKATKYLQELGLLMAVGIAADLELGDVFVSSFCCP